MVKSPERKAISKIREILTEINEKSKVVVNLFSERAKATIQLVSFNLPVH